MNIKPSIRFAAIGPDTARGGAQVRRFTTHGELPNEFSWYLIEAST